MSADDAEKVGKLDELKETQYMSGRRRKCLKKRIRRANTKGRGVAFAAFIVEIFGLELLQSGCLVDVAGGRGDTSWELALKWSIRCCIIDPQRLRLSKHRQNIVLCRSCTANAVCSSENTTSSNFVSMDFEVYETIESEGGDAAAIATTTIGQEVEVDMIELERCMGITQERRLFVAEDKCLDLIQTASLLIGLHADEATETIVDVALDTGKPFAIVPCCVFPTLFPHRRMATGEHVRTLESFLVYLQSKHPNIQRAVVPNLFPPNNIVLYKLS